MTTLTAQDVERLAALAEKATPGPWFVGTMDGVPEEATNVRNGDSEGPRVASCFGAYRAHIATANADFIAACDPQTILALCSLALRGMEREGEAVAWRSTEVVTVTDEMVEAAANSIYPHAMKSNDRRIRDRHLKEARAALEAALSAAPGVSDADRYRVIRDHAEEGEWWRLVFDPDNGEEPRLLQGAELDAAINEFIAAKAR